MREDLEYDRAAILSQPTRTNDYRAIQLELNVARTNEALGLRTSGFKYRSLMVYRVDADVTIRLNQPNKDPILIPAGTLISLTDHDFEEVYLTNVAGAAGTWIYFWVGFNRRESQAVK